MKIFRIYSKKDNKWLIPKGGGEITVGDGVIIFRDFEPNKHGGYSFKNYRFFEIDDNVIVEQYIKDDDNGRRLFDNDLVQVSEIFYFGDDEHTKIIKVNLSDYESLKSLKRSKRTKKLGNIHDNPELLHEIWYNKEKEK